MEQNKRKRDLLEKQQAENKSLISKSEKTTHFIVNNSENMRAKFTVMLVKKGTAACHDSKLHFISASIKEHYNLLQVQIYT